MRMLVCVYNRRHTDNRGIREEGTILVGNRPFFCPWGQRAFNQNYLSAYENSGSIRPKEPSFLLYTTLTSSVSALENTKKLCPRSSI